MTSLDAPIQPHRSTRLPWLVIASAVATGLLLGSTKHARRTSGRQHDTPATGAFGEPRSTDEPEWLQHARATQPGRGREAISPWQIPWRGWKDILWRTYEEIGNDRLTSVAAGVVFFALLAIFPAVTALVSSYGLFADPATIIDHLQLGASVLPPGAFDIVRDQVDRIVSQGGGGLTLAFVFGLGLALWSANAGVKAIFDALNVIYDEDEKRSFITLNLASLAVTVGAVLLFLVFAGAVVVFPLVLNLFGLTHVFDSALPLLRWPALFVLFALALAVIYRFGPSRDRAKWQWVSVGSLFASAAWLLISVGFSWYLSNFADYNATYGSLGAVIGLMMWMWLSTCAVLVGAELNAELEHQTARDTTRGPQRPLGARGAAMADTVGEAKA